MKISIIGCGYVGLVTGACLAKLGNRVVCVDVDKKKVEMISQALSPIYEDGLDKLLSSYKDKIKATTDYNFAVNESDVTFICVGTPSKNDGTINLKHITSASTRLGKSLRNKKGFHVVVVKSTVLPGTTEEIVKPIIEKESGKTAFKDFGLASNPEFLREGNAVKDFFNADRIVIGVKDQKTKEMFDRLYSSFDCPKFFTDIKTSEMIKYVSNAFLSTKISFANEIGNTCKKLGIDTYKVFEGVGLDHRINPAFFRAGIGFGGSCFPKDVRALIAKADEIGSETRILKSVIDVNKEQPKKLTELLQNHLTSLKNKKIGVLGLAFKPNTDDTRDSRAIPIVETLIENEVNVVAYDPMAMDNFKKLFPQIEYANSCKEVLDSDAVLIVTEWKDFNDLDYTGKIVIDGRKIEKAKKEASIYEGVCW